MSGSQFETDLATIYLRETSKLRLTDQVLVDDQKQKVIERYLPVGVVCLCSYFECQALINPSDLVRMHCPVVCIVFLPVVSIIELGHRNVPLILCVVKLAVALLAGNTLIIKPSPFTPLTTLQFVKDIQHLVPPGVVSVLSGDDGLGPMITAHPGISKVCNKVP